ncbi:MAG: general secretion pathway protein GspK [Candidatus Omnitrophica bacterium]|nr:general secretion pathway protein GspK [Candidatus Omnitrophota bacterium]
MVLWTLFFLSALAVALNAYLRPQLNVVYKLKNKTQADYLAQAALQRAMAELVNHSLDANSALKESWNSGQEKFKDIALGDGAMSIMNPLGSGGENDFKYGLVDEERKININKASLDVLTNFFEIAGGLLPQQAGDIATAILHWRGTFLKPGEVCTENEYYQTLTPAYSCKNKEFEVLEELLLVKGITRATFDKVKDRLTIYGGGAVNINTADMFVLRSLGISDSLADKIIRFRNGDDGKEATADDHIFLATENIANVLHESENLTQEETDQLTAMATAGLFCVRSDNFTGIAVGKVTNSGTSTQVAFVFNRNQKIVSWREE